MEIRIRPATSKDIPELRGLCVQLGYESSLLDIENALDDLGESHAVLVAELQDSALGWVEIVVSTLLTSGKEAQICGLVVDESHRGRRIGHDLCLAAEDWARQKGLEAIRVRSRESRERAHRFYENLGYDVYKTQLVFRKRL